MSLDAASALIWRGQEYADAPTLQPRLDVGWGPIYLAASGSWSIDGAWAGKDLLGALILTAPGGGELGILAAGYYQADASTVLEAGVAYRGPAPLRPYALLSRNFANDPDEAVYGELGLAPSSRLADVRAFVGAALQGGAYYSADDGGVVSVGLSLDRTLRPTSRVSIQLGVAGVHNPQVDRTWAVARVGTSLGLWSERRGPTLEELLPSDTRR